MIQVRKGDVVFRLRQDNRDRQVLVEQVQEEGTGLYQLLGYEIEDCVGAPLQMFLPNDISEKLDDYVEYRSDGQDVAAVMGKIRGFRMLSKGGKPVRLDMRMVRDVMEDEQPRFLMLLQRRVVDVDPTLQTLRAVQEEARNKTRYGVPEAETFMEIASAVEELVAVGKVKATLAVVRVEQFERFEEGQMQKVIQGIVAACRQTFRESDFIAYLGLRKIGVLLLEADFMNARIALNRLRWQLPAQEGAAKIEYRTVFIELDANETAAESMDKCKAALADEKVDGVGVLV
ncbi:MAG: hypothetical protein H6908_02345 [Hyphomicrobiales bacterium]|nr:hypothetical protein [Rickettsiales bacterium]MCP5361471.1 hypothetical protein [Hyphomicrobiales bacterium]